MNEVPIIKMEYKMVVTLFKQIKYWMINQNQHLKARCQTKIDLLVKFLWLLISPHFENEESNSDPQE